MEISSNKPRSPSWANPPVRVFRCWWRPVLERSRGECSNNRSGPRRSQNSGCGLPVVTLHVRSPTVCWITFLSCKHEMVRFSPSALHTHGKLKNNETSQAPVRPPRLPPFRLLTEWSYLVLRDDQIGLIDVASAAHGTATAAIRDENNIGMNQLGRGVSKRDARKHQKRGRSLRCRRFRS